MLANDAVTRAEPQARSLPNRLCSEEGFKGVFRMPKTRPCIRKLNAYLRLTGPNRNDQLAPADLFQGIHCVRNDL